MKIIAIILLLSVCLAVQAEDEQLATPNAVKTEIHKHGSKSVVNSIFNTKSWGIIINGIASGEPQWLDVAKLLASGSDAGSASELRDAVAWALPHSPKEVILLANEEWLFNDTCSGPPVDEPPGGYKKYFELSIEAVTNISDPKLKRLKLECIKKLNAAKERPAW